jgi:AraC-like DNA-binding protein
MLSLPYDIVCGYFDCSEFGDLAVSPKRRVAKFEIEFYIEDGLSTFADGKEYVIKKNYIQIAKPGQIRYSRLPLKTMYLKFCVEGDIADKLNAAPEYFLSSHPVSIAEKLDEIILFNESGNNELMLYSRLLSFINLVLYDSQIPNLQSGANYAIIQKAKRYMEANFSDSIHLEDVASHVNLSPIYFHNVFTSASGQSPHDYLIKYRISQAKKMLWDSSISLSLVAEECGFGCQQYFNKIFKKETGISPGKYRKEFQQNYME